MSRHDLFRALWLGIAVAVLIAAGAHAQCIPQGPLPDALLNCRNWITFAPPRPFDPRYGIFPTEDQLRDVLAMLTDEGWRGLVTYSLDGTLSQVPRIAKEVGFTMVIAGIYWFNRAQLERERTAAAGQLTWIDGFVLGNEGLEQRRYTRSELESEIALLEADTNLPVVTSEPFGQYMADHTLLYVGDWVFPDIHAWFTNIRSVPNAVSWVRDRYHDLEELATGRRVIIKESWWPSGGDPAATASNQTLFFQLLSGTDVMFVWGEAFDQFWKTAEGPQGPHWGVHTDSGVPKPIILDLEKLYTGSY